MSYYVQTRWGDSEDNPKKNRMQEILAELDAADPEHPDTWLSHESGWTLSVFESGLIVWENPELDGGARYQEQVSRVEALRLWLLLSRGEFEVIESMPWLDGYGPPIADEELRRRQQVAAEITLNIQRESYDKLGPEDDARTCRHDACSRGTVKFSVFCRPHHFENLYKQPSPFTH